MNLGASQCWRSALFAVLWLIVLLCSPPTLAFSVVPPTAGIAVGVYLNPDTGRFWTMDSYEGNSIDPLSLHKYLYAGENPVDNIDPSGHDFELGGMLSVMDISSSLFAMISPVSSSEAKFSPVAFSPSIIVDISVDPSGALSSFNPSDVQNALQTQLSTKVFDSPPAGQSLTVKIHKEGSPPGSPGWHGSPKNLYINRVDWNLHSGIASSGNDANSSSWWGAGGYTSINAQGVVDYCNKHGSGPTTQTFVNILAHEVIWLNAGGNWDHDVQGSSDISNGLGYPAFAPFTVSPKNRLKLRDEFGF